MLLKKAEILCVGTELLIGDIVNTNAAFLSRRLAELGIGCYRQSVVGDNPGRMKEALAECLARCDLLLITGGLGPTYDDLTKECAAEAMGRSLYLHEESLARIRAFFDGRKIEMPETNVKQAMIPEGSFVFQNDYGTAPGMAIEDEAKGKIVVLMPGPPREIEPMFDERVMPYLRRFTEETFVSRNIHIIGKGESEVEYLLREHMMNAVNPTVAPYCQEGEVRLRVTARAATREEGLAMCDREIETIRQSEVGPYIYGIDTDPARAVLEALRKSGRTLAAAESCTGGLISKIVTDIPGCSDVFLGGAVTYCNALKQSMLGVKKETLERDGAVSEACAAEMAEGIRRACGSSIGVSVTGIAGPDGGSAEKPVGTVWCAVSDGNRTVTRLLHLTGTRAHIRQVTSVRVFSLILEFLR